MAVTSAPPFPLTGGRRAALFVGVPVCLALVASTGFSLVSDFGQGSYPVSYSVPAGTRALTLNVDGRLTIGPATTGQATLAGTAKYSIVRSKVTETTTGGGTAFGYHCPVPTGDCELDATLTVPATVTALTTSTGAGDATVAGTKGPVKLSTGEGNLSVSDASGPLTLNTGKGSIVVRASTPATLSASSGDGDIQAVGVTSAAIAANTDSGSITWSGIAAGTVTASSGNGDIQITFTSVPDNVRVNTDSGSITLVLPPGATTYHVAANTDSGSVSVTVPRATSSRHVITASSGSGSITIERQQPAGQ